MRPSTLGPDKTIEIATRRAAGERGVDLAREFGISQQAVCDIARGRTGASLGGPITPARPRQSEFCTVDNCGKRSGHASMCDAHYARVRRGAPMYGRKKTATTPIGERLMRHVSKLPSGCWEFTGNRGRKGYGQLTTEDRSSARAHRVSWETFRGPIPPGVQVLHRCDNRPCVNPDHLFLGTNAANMQDMTSKGRQAVGEKVARSVLTAAQVLDIRRRRNAGERIEDLAREFGMSYMGLYSAAVGLTWKHISDSSAPAATPKPRIIRQKP